MSLDNEIQKIFSDVENFLKQQQELYGDILMAAPKKTTEIISESEPAKTDNPATTEVDLFGKESALSESSKKHGNTALLPYPNEPWVTSQSLTELNSKINTCMKCGLGQTRNKFVFGVGNPKAEVVLVGEAPGADEDAQGEPFVGRGGQLLTKIIEAINFKREEVYICNILKCRPPNNRDPQADEVDCCEPYLWKQLEIIKPKMILCVGRIAGQSLLKTNASLTVLREKVHDYRGIPLMVTYHPAALLRNPHWKKPCWEDVQKFRKMYDDMKAGK
jgi:uracil-DNA glycosylase